MAFIQNGLHAGSLCLLSKGVVMLSVWSSSAFESESKLTYSFYKNESGRIHAVKQKVYGNAVQNMKCFRGRKTMNAAFILFHYIIT